MRMTKHAPNTPEPDLWRSNGGTETVLFDMAKGLPVRNVIGVGDPDIHLLDGRWMMFLGGFTTGFAVRIFEARLPVGDELDSDRWALRTVPGRPRRAAQLFTPPRLGSWDSHGTHTPSYVSGRSARGTPAQRIYYAGRSTIRNGGPGSRYAIGAAELQEGRWIRRASPVLTGDSRRPSAFEPLVRYEGGTWRIWYLSAPNEVGRDEQPDYELRYRESADGLTQWSAPTTLFTSDEGYFDNTVHPVDGGFEMLLARGSNLYGTKPYPRQGLWWARSHVPSGTRADWTADPVRILDAETAPPWWLERGAFGPEFHYGRRATDETTMYVFTSGTSAATPWLRSAIQRLRERKLPPAPTPFILSVGRLTIPHAGGTLHGG